MIADLHSTWGWVAVGLAGAVGLWGLVLAARRTEPGPWFWRGVGVATVAMLIQVGLGFVLYAQGERPGTIHMFYGIVMLFAFAFAYIYRPQFSRRPALAWGVFMLFIMGLGIRAITSFGRSF